MIAFYFFAGLLLLFALAVLFRSLLKHDLTDETNHQDVNIGIARDRKALVKDALSKGHIDKDTYVQEVHDIEQTLASELAEGPKVAQSRAMRLVGIVLLVGLLPVTAGVLYTQHGTPQALDPLFLERAGAVTLANGATVNNRYAEYIKNGGTPKHFMEALASADSANANRSANASAQAEANNEQQASLQQLLPQLEEKLAANPDDADGWNLLGRTYMNIGEFAKAERAFERLNELDPNNPDTLLILAEAKALQQSGDLGGDAQDLIRQALSVNPQHERGRLLLALSLQQQGKHEEALPLFQALRANPNISADAVENLTLMIEQSRAALGQASDPITNAEATSGAAITVTVSLNDDARAAVDAAHTVFIYAVASAGPPMPLAVVRQTVNDLPITVTLDDTQAMMPSMKLSSFPSVTVGARVSASGDALSQSGDWFGEQLDVATLNSGSSANDNTDDTNTISIVIDQQKP